jgi:hypothetical protein
LLFVYEFIIAKTTKKHENLQSKEFFVEKELGGKGGNIVIKGEITL